MGTFIRLVDSKTAQDKEKDFFDIANRYLSSEVEFKKIPNNLYAYWVSEATIKSFENESLAKVFTTREGMATANNDLFLKLWHEVDFERIEFNCESEEDSLIKQVKWVPYNKGGGTRDWYGNNDYVVDWENNGKEIKANIDPKTGRVRSHNYNGEYGFRQGLTWSAISSGDLSVRFCEKGFLFDSKGAKGFSDSEDELYWILALLNSKVSMQFLQFISPTLDFKVGDVILIPFVENTKTEQEVIELSKRMVSIAKNEWDSYETSWDFMRHPILNTGKIEDAYNKWLEDTKNALCEGRQNEERINQLLITEYGLDSEIDSAIDINDVTLRIADIESAVKSLISYAVGCIMGRYSLKEEGLIYAGGTWDASRYSDDFRPCDYGVMLITEDQYFEEDLCTRVIDFIEVVYGKDTLNENLSFIAQALKPGAKESARQVLRNYLFDEKGFFDNHYQVYQHRPIYWMMSSGKNGGFRAIVYMHRYDQNTLSIVRSDFLHELRYKYEADQSLQHKKEVEAATTADRNDAKKKIAALDKKMVEVNQYDDLINHATGNITAFTFDLDDGVKTNYSKFLNIDGVKTQNLLVPIKL